MVPWPRVANKPTPGSTVRFHVKNTLVSGRANAFGGASHSRLSVRWALKLCLGPYRAAISLGTRLGTAPTFKTLSEF